MLACPAFSVLPEETRQQEYEGPADSTLTLIRDIDSTVDQYDAFGNILSRTTRTGDGYVDAESAHYDNIDNSVVPWLIGLPNLVTQTSKSPTGESTTRTTKPIFDHTTGLKVAEIIEPNGDESTFKQTQYARDPVTGVLTGIAEKDLSGMVHRRWTISYDPLDRVYPNQITNGLGQSVSMAIHPGLGALALQLDENGVTSKWRYDGFGRLKQVVGPDGATTTMTYTGTIYAQDFLLLLRMSDPSGQNVAVQFDRYGNEGYRQWFGFDGQIVSIIRRYDSQSLLAALEGPCATFNNPCPVETYDYDQFGRLRHVVHSDQSIFQVTYENLKQVMTDENAHVAYVTYDQLGRVATQTRTSDHDVVTAYTFGPFGLVRHVVDAAKNDTEVVYDVRGRRTNLIDRDTGKHVYKWNTFDEITSESDANGTTTYDLDDIGRIRHAFAKDGVTFFGWDTVPNGIGKLGSTSSPDGVRTAYSYDSLGRPTGTSWLIKTKRRGGQRRFELTVGYDQISRINLIKYPTDRKSLNRLDVSRMYNPRGYLSSLQNATTSATYWTASRRNPRGQLTDEVLGNTLRTHRQYDDRGVLTGISTTGDRGPVQNISYVAYPNGNLHIRADGIQGLIESFTYDPLDRLSDWNVTQTKNATTVTLLDHSFKYDDVGNLCTRIANLGPKDDRVYQYGQNGAGPHAPTQLNDNLYGYDGIGNQTSGPGRTIAYTSFSKPATITLGKQQYSLAYDAFQNRVLKRYPNGDFKVTIAGLYELRVQSGQPTEVFYIPAAERVVAQVERAGPIDRVTYMHDDSLSSLESITDESGDLVEHRKYEPYGELRDPSDVRVAPSSINTSVTRGYTDHEHDFESQLINMGGRLYDPTLAHFLTADPVVKVPTSSKSLNRYSYVFDNPLRFTDPTGYQTQDEYGPEDFGPYGVICQPGTCAEILTSLPLPADFPPQHVDWLPGPLPVPAEPTPGPAAGDDSGTANQGATQLNQVSPPTGPIVVLRPFQGVATGAFRVYPPVNFIGIRESPKFGPGDITVEQAIKAGLIEETQRGSIPNTNPEISLQTSETALKILPLYVEVTAMLGAAEGAAAVQTAKGTPELLSKFAKSTIDDVVSSAARPRSSLITEGARAIAKKLGAAGSGGYTSAFQGIAPTQANAESLIRNIMSNPSRAFYGEKVIDVYNAAGQGVRLQAGTGRFMGFLEGGLSTQ